MNTLPDELVRCVFDNFRGGDERMIGWAGGVDKRFLSISRERHIWEQYYYDTFPKFKITNDSKHQGDCTYDRCKVGRSWRPFDICELGHNDRLIIGGRLTTIKCRNPAHYLGLNERAPTSKFKDMFHRSAKRYWTINKNNNWGVVKERQLAREIRALVKLREKIERSEKRIESLRVKKKVGVDIKSKLQYHLDFKATKTKTKK